MTMSRKQKVEAAARTARRIAEETEGFGSSLSGLTQAVGRFSTIDSSKWPTPPGSTRLTFRCNLSSGTVTRCKSTA